MDGFPRAAVKKYQRLGGLNNRHLFSRSSGSWKSKINMLAGLVSSYETSLFSLQMAVFSLCPEIIFLLCVHVCVQISSSYRDTSHIRL